MEGNLPSQDIVHGAALDVSRACLTFTDRCYEAVVAATAAVQAVADLMCCHVH